MKDKNGIEIKCDNCNVNIQRDCSNWNYTPEGSDKCTNEFLPSPKAYESRISELQAQQFTAEEVDGIMKALSRMPYPYNRISEEVESSIVEKCDAILKGAE